MWYHMALRGFFIDATDLPCRQLIASTPDWEELAAKIPKEDVQAFVSAKLGGLISYLNGTRETERMIEELKAGKLQREEVIDHVEALYK